jgi:hypothetical protein
MKLERNDYKSLLAILKSNKIDIKLFSVVKVS